MPLGADAVVQVEDTDLLKDADSGSVELEINIKKAPKVGQDIRFKKILLIFINIPELNKTKNREVFYVYLSLQRNRK